MRKEHQDNCERKEQQVREKGLKGALGVAWCPRASVQGCFPRNGLTFHGAPEHPLCCVRMSFVLGLQVWASSAPTRGSACALGRDWAGEGHSKRVEKLWNLFPAPAAAPPLCLALPFLSPSPAAAPGWLLSVPVPVFVPRAPS